MNSRLIALCAAKQFSDFHRCTEMRKRLETEDVSILETAHAEFGILVKQGFQYLPCLITVFAEIVAFLHIVGTFLSGEGWLVEGHMTNDVENVGIPQRFILLTNGINEYGIFFQFINGQELLFCILLLWLFLLVKQAEGIHTYNTLSNGILHDGSKAIDEDTLSGCTQCLLALIIGAGLQESYKAFCKVLVNFVQREVLLFYNLTFHQEHPLLVLFHD